jgi:hypothetical protein
MPSVGSAEDFSVERYALWIYTKTKTQLQPGTLYHPGHKPIKNAVAIGWMNLYRPCKRDF